MRLHFERYKPVLQVALLSLLTSAFAQAPDQYLIPGNAVYPESIAVDAKTDNFYTGSISDGTLYRGELSTGKVTVFSPAGADGRKNAAGIKLDPQGRLWVAAGYQNKVFVYDTNSARLVREYTLPQNQNVVPNDLVRGQDGAMYITDSLRPVLYRVPTSATTLGDLSEWLDFTGTALTYQAQGLNANGIVASGHDLLIATTNAGKLYRVDIRDKSVLEVKLNGTDLGNADSLLLRGRTLYVARNADNEVVSLRLSADLSSAEALARVSLPLFRFPTSLALAGERVLVLNAQLNALQNNNPVLPFTVSVVPIAAFRAGR